jgi:aspartyl aminopeptidase
VAEVMNLTGEYSELNVRRCLSKSCMLSSDVSSAFDPGYASSFDKKNVAYLGCGMVFNKFTGSRGKSGSNDANAEYIAHIRNIFDKENINFQTAELGKVDLGGGGTIAYILAEHGMNVIDSGVAVLNMHAPWEATSKADVYETYRGYRAFVENADL